MKQIVYAVVCKSDGSLIAIYATRELAEARIARSFSHRALLVSMFPVEVD